MNTNTRFTNTYAGGDGSVWVEARAVGDTAYTYVPCPHARILRTRLSEFKAHWDSGNPDTPAVVITLWDGTDSHMVKVTSALEMWIDEAHYRRYSPVILDATEQDRAEEAARIRAAGYVDRILHIASRAWMIEAGKTVVRVVKGRKTPQGQYEVTKHARGDYGPYVHLRNTDGIVFPYVNIENVQVVPDYAGAFDRHGFVKLSTVEGKFLARMFENRFADPIDWLVYADYLQENGSFPDSWGEKPAAFSKLLADRHYVWREEEYGAPVASSISFTPEQFAVALRNVVNDRYKHSRLHLDLFAITRHNQITAR